MPTAFPEEAAPRGAGPEESLTAADLFRDRPDLPALLDLDDQPALAPDVRELVLDRLDAAWREGLLKLTPEQFLDVQCALLPEEAVPRLPEAAPCPHPVGRPGRLAAYAERAALGLPLASAADLDPAADDRAAGLKVKKRANGTGRVGAGEPEAAVRVLGLAAPAAGAVPPGMLRAADGTWFDVAAWTPAR